MDCYDISLLQYCVYYDTSRLLYPPLARKIPVVLRRLENGQTGDFQSILGRGTALHWTSLHLVCITTCTICERKGVKKYKKSDWLVREKDFEGLRRGAKIVRSTKHTALRKGPSSGSNETSFTAPFAALALIYFHWKRQTRHSNSLRNKQENNSSESIVMICNPWANSNEVDAMVTEQSNSCWSV